MNLIYKDINQINGSNIILKKNKKILNEELELSKKNYLRYKELNNKGVISDVDLEKKELDYLQQMRRVQDVEITIYNNKIKINQLKTQIVNLKESKDNESYSDEVEKEDSYKILKEEINKWKETHFAVIVKKINRYLNLV